METCCSIGKARSTRVPTCGTSPHKGLLDGISVVGFVWLLIAFASPGLSQRQAWLDLSGYDKSSGIEVSTEGSLLAVTWPGEQGRLFRLRFDLADMNLLIRDISIAKGSDFLPILEKASPRYLSVSGKRRGGWNNFIDSPAKHGLELKISESSLARDMVQVTSDHQRVQVAVSGLDIGIFRGKLVFTFYKGSNLVQQEAVVQTHEPDVAFYYEAWLTHCSTRNLKTLAWLNTEGQLVRHVLMSDIDLDKNRLQVFRRALIAEGPNGSLGLFPAPHQFFFARDETTNLASVWYRSYGITEQEDFFSFGIRQAPEGGGVATPLYNAPPGTWQRLKLFYYISPAKAEEALRGISAYTHNDSFKPLPGYLTFTPHYHMAVGMASVAHNREPYEPEFKKVFKDMGVNILLLHDYHIDGHPFSPTPRRLEELDILFAECKRLSDGNFLMLPGEEGYNYLGGHWTAFFPKPIHWYWVRPEGQPFLSTEASYGNVYRVGSAADMYELIHREKGLVWQTHPRTKGSTGYPDRLVNQDYYQDPRWLGAAFKNLPTDLSSPRLGDRALNLLDDMNNWGGRKFLVGEVDVFKIDHSDEIYAHMNINYLKMDRLPTIPDWSEVLEALTRGDFFVTTGEILIRNFTVGGKQGGAKLILAQNNPVEIQAEVEWTFPLSFVELVWGDGKNVDRLIVPATESPQFGQKVFRITKNLKGVKWVRFAAWDTAANGAFTQPVYIESRP